MQPHLIPHPAHPSDAVEFVSVVIERQPDGLFLLFVVEGDSSRLVLPPPAKPSRADGLWRSTCFELFVRDGGTAYREFNFAPSGQWAAYRFADYRGAREALELDAPPEVHVWDEPFVGIMLSALVPAGIAAGARIGLSAVIEETDGRKSYWALAHPPGEPDFHQADCFAFELPAPAL